MQRKKMECPKAPELTLYILSFKYIKLPRLQKH